MGPSKSQDRPTRPQAGCPPAQPGEIRGPAALWPQPPLLSPVLLWMCRLPDRVLWLALRCCPIVKVNLLHSRLPIMLYVSEDCQAGGCPVVVSQGQQRKSSRRALGPALLPVAAVFFQKLTTCGWAGLGAPRATASLTYSALYSTRRPTRLMGITDGAACPPACLVSCQPAGGLLKHPVQVGHPRAPIGSWPPADPSLAVTPTDATGRQDRLSPQMGQLILLWPSWHLLGTTLHCLTTLTVLAGWRACCQPAVLQEPGETLSTIPRLENASFQVCRTLQCPQKD